MKKSTIDALIAQQLNLPLPLNRQTLEEAQFALLRHSLAHAKAHNAFYQKHLAEVTPKSICCYKDLATLPFLPQEALMTPNIKLQCLSQSEVVRIVTLATSGTTGTPKRIAFDGTDLQSTTDFFRAGMKNLLHAGDAVLILLPAEKPDSTGDLLQKSLSGEKSDNPCFALWPPDTKKAAQLISTHNIRTIVGLPQHLLALSCHIPFAQVRTMLLCSDYAPPPLRKRIEKSCGCTTFLHYGTTESGLGGGVECAMHDGCHLREGDFLLEIIDPDTEGTLPEGEIGEVVLTTISRRCMPLFRYRTGDMAALLRKTCHCGAISTRLHSILGRNKKYRLADGAILTSQILDDCLFAEPALLDYRATLRMEEREERLDIDYLAGGHLLAKTLRQRLPKNLPSGRTEAQNADFFSCTHTAKRTIYDGRNTKNENPKTSLYSM